MLVLLPRFLTTYGPAIAAVSVTFFGGGLFSTKVLLRKLIPQSRHLWWCLGIPLIFILITFGSFAIGGVSMAQLGNFLANDWHWLAFQFVGQFFIVAIGEELGWRGWLLPTLAQRRSLITCVVWIIVIWGLWHLPIFFSGPQIVIPWLMMLVAMAFLTTWLWYKADGNVFVLAVMHASFNASEVFLENRLRNIEGGEKLILSGWATLGYAYVLVACLIVASHRKILIR